MPSASIFTLFPGTEWEHSLYASANTFFVSADALTNATQLSISGYSGHDTLEIDDASSENNARYNPALQRETVPTYTIDSRSLTYRRPVAASTPLSLPSYSSATVNFSGLTSLTLKGLDATTGGIIGRTYILDSWSDATSLNIQGGSGDDIFDLGNGKLDNVSGTLFHSLPINIDGGAGKNTIIYDDSKDGDYSYTDASGQIVKVTSDLPSWQIAPGRVERSNSITNFQNDTTINVGSDVHSS